MPIASPSFSSCANSTLTLAATTRPFLASPKCSGAESPVFDAHGDVSEQEDGNPSDQDSLLSRRVSRPFRRRKSTHQTFDSVEEDRNGESKQEVGEINIAVNDDVKMEDEDQDELLKAIYRERTQQYEKLLEFFADELKQPQGYLTDLVK
ncbi:hypothetical protein BGZ65_000757, partial [Modicella reniformis]